MRYSQTFIAEVVLCILVTSFNFGLTDRKITWNVSTISYPSIGEESAKPEMILKVQAAQ